MSGQKLEVPREFRRGGKAKDEEESKDTARNLIKVMYRGLGLEDFRDSRILDMGCGVKMVQVMMEDEIPLGGYVGIDVFSDLIEYLKANVTDPRFEFHSLDLHNEMYNPDGERLTADTQLPVPEASFDVICLFSVFTHLAPEDYVAMLKMLRRYIKPGGKLIYSLFVFETTEGGHGFMDQVAKWMVVSEEDLEKWPGPPDFKDWDPKNPLKWAIYSRKHALELLEGTGWEMEALNDPEPSIQHYMICSPV